MKVMITGPQGSGKTTQAKLVAGKLGLCLVKTGDLVRAKALEDDEIGRSLKASLDSGDLSDDAVVASLVKPEIESDRCRMGFVVDGFPRRLSQLQYFDPQFDKVFYLDVADATAKTRMLRRGREDDTPELIEERLKVFHQLTDPVIAYYRNLGKLVKVNGEQPIEKVTEEILSHLKDD